MSETQFKTPQDWEAIEICNNQLLDTYKSYNGATLRRSIMKVEQDLEALRKLYNDLHKVYLSSQELLERERNDRHRTEQENSVLLQELQNSRQRESILQRSYEAVLNTNLILHSSHQGLIQEFGAPQMEQQIDPLSNALGLGLAISYALEPPVSCPQVDTSTNFLPLLEETPSLGSCYTSSTATSPAPTDESSSSNGGPPHQDFTYTYM
ncbi:hypothetical protein TWF594_007854 [Orbilia oligospora]|uniref:Uncharacterized protein n=1 Tax=Orbilia oligospora TaxID=2813651 RepID=A0A7C8NWH1_ORBOL|nr:hypothetical protein TWF706_002540 [Orbilia oligospora]KAF3136592.1 hypothetical protein TWF594_007854 [Orbilia oligospora]KAF3147193.1 hypothetical protein TWF703_000033 [Orbilia oligospora]